MAKLTPALKFKYSMYSTFIFYILSSSQMYKLTSKILPTSIDGCPTPFGLLIHSIVFLLALYGIMTLPKDLE